jgi:hypothetical protein
VRIGKAYVEISRHVSRTELGMASVSIPQLKEKLKELLLPGSYVPSESTLRRSCP